MGCFQIFEIASRQKNRMLLGKPFVATQLTIPSEFVVTGQQTTCRCNSPDANRLRCRLEGKPGSFLSGVATAFAVSTLCFPSIGFAAKTMSKMEINSTPGGRNTLRRGVLDRQVGRTRATLRGRFEPLGFNRCRHFGQC